MSDRRRRLVPAALAVALGLVAVEVGLRVLPFELPRGVRFPAEGRLTRRDPELIWRLAPNAESEVSTSEYRTHRRTNSVGMREREIAPRAPAETRVLALGDSFVFGSGVEEDEAFPRVTESLLRARGRTVTVFNAGVPAYNLDQSYRAFPERFAQSDPDVVVAGVSCSDVEEGWAWPLYAPRDGKLEPLAAWKTGFYLQGLVIEAMPSWLSHSALYEQLLRRLPARDFFGQRPWLSHEELRAWSREKMALELEEIDRSARASGRRAIALFLPCKEQLDPATALVYGDLEARVEAAGVEVVDGMGALRRSSPDVTRFFFVKDTHMNRDGHAAIAAALADVLEKDISVGR